MVTMNTTAPHIIEVHRLGDYTGPTDGAGQPIDPHPTDVIYAGRADVQWGDVRVQRSMNTDREEADVTVVMPEYAPISTRDFLPNDVIAWDGYWYRITSFEHMWDAVFAIRDQSCNLPTT